MERTDGRWCARVWPPRKAPSTAQTPLRLRQDPRRGHRKRARSRRSSPGPAQRPRPDRRRLHATAGSASRSGSTPTPGNWPEHGGLLPGQRRTPHHPRRRADPAVIKLADLSVPVVREWQNRLGQKPIRPARRKLRKGETALPPPPPLSLRTVAYCRSILHKALEDALRDETAGLKRNPVALVKPPRKRQKKARPTVCPAHVGKLLVAMSEDRLWCYWLVAFALGFRRGEGLGMEWGDLDLERRMWTPRMAVQRIRGDPDPVTGRRRGRLVAKELKTEASTAAVADPRGRSRGADPVAAGPAQAAHGRAALAASWTWCSRPASGRRWSRGASTGRGSGCAEAPGCPGPAARPAARLRLLPPRRRRRPEDGPGVPAARARVHDPDVPPRARGGPARRSGRHGHHHRRAPAATGPETG